MNLEQRTFTIPGQPYRYFTADLIWSAVVLATIAVGLMLYDSSATFIAGTCGILGMFMVRMMVRRAMEERAARAPLGARAEGMRHGGRTPTPA